MDKGRDEKTTSQVVYVTDSLWRSSKMIIIKTNNNSKYYCRVDDVPGTAMSILCTSMHATFTSLWIGSRISVLQVRTLKYRETLSSLPKIIWLVGTGAKIWTQTVWWKIRLKRSNREQIKKTLKVRLRNVDYAWRQWGISEGGLLQEDLSDQIWVLKRVLWREQGRGRVDKKWW